MQKTIIYRKNQRWYKQIKEIYHVLWSEESILWKWLYYPKQSTDSMQSLSNYQWYFSRIRTNNLTVGMETQKIPDSQSNLEEEKMELEKSTFLTSDYTTKLQSSRQYSTGTKTEI